MSKDHTNSLPRGIPSASGPPHARHEYFDNEGKEDVEDPIERKLSSSSSSGVYEPINPGDDAVLTRLASQFSRSQSYYYRRGSTQDGSTLERKGTLEGLEPNDPVFDPTNPSFDLYKYLRMTMKILENESIVLQRAGVVLRNVNVSGSGSAINLQSNIGSLLMAPLRINEHLHLGHKQPKPILRNFHGIVKSGELLIVLGRPGSGCSTFLKTMTGEMHGLDLEKSSVVHYNGVTQKKMMREFKGEVVYNQEVDKHFPHLTVGETLEHAAALRVPSHRPQGVSRKDAVKHITQVVMAVYGLSHTYNTKVGNDFVRGVSGGERKRVSIAEMALAGSPVAAWDNSTRGLDSATALAFTKSLRQTANIAGSMHSVAIYQACGIFCSRVISTDIWLRPAKPSTTYSTGPLYCTKGDRSTLVQQPGQKRTSNAWAGFVRSAKLPEIF